MHPNVFIDQLWRGTENDTVFVAMSFAPEYDERFHQVFRPAIEAAQYRGRNLTAVRVDESKSGDSIITEIVRGVCEARLVLVDVSAMPAFVGAPSAARNGNVMYELGLAHAVKSPARVLIVRDDSEKLLFDVTSIPHVQVDFSDLAAARLKVGTLLEDRIKESVQIQDFKVTSFVGSMSEFEAGVVVQLWNLGACPIVDIRTEVGDKKIVPIPMQGALRSLRAEGLIRSHLQLDPFAMFYSLTERGKEAARVLVKTIQAQAKKTK